MSEGMRGCGRWVGGVGLIVVSSPSASLVRVQGTDRRVLGLATDAVYVPLHLHGS